MITYFFMALLFLIGVFVGMLASEHRAGKINESIRRPDDDDTILYDYDL